MSGVEPLLSHVRCFLSTVKKRLQNEKDFLQQAINTAKREYLNQTEIHAVL